LVTKLIANELESNLETNSFGSQNLGN